MQKIYIIDMKIHFKNEDADMLYVLTVSCSFKGKAERLYDSKGGHEGRLVVKGTNPGPRAPWVSFRADSPMTLRVSHRSPLE